jgi:glucose-6-phosphate isomerase
MNDLHAFRSLFFHDEELGVSLDLSCMGLDHQWLLKQKPRCDAALKAMASLEAGAIANPDEGRQVGHYWLRNPSLSPDPSVGKLILATNESIARFATSIIEGGLRTEAGERFTDVLLIGIGGSALGPQLLDQCLASPLAVLRLHFLDNTDPDGIERVLMQLDERLKTTLVLSISKSGGTAETRNGTLLVRKAMESLGLRFRTQAVAITADGSALSGQATAEGWLATFPMWDWVGGRTSVTSAVGLLPAALRGIDTDALLRGAAAMDRRTREPDLFRNPGLLLTLALWFGSEGTGAKDLVVLPYRDRLVLFSRYLQQLIMESLGKEKNLLGEVVQQGLTVYGNKGSTDQHAFVQQLREGVPNFFVAFVEVLEDGPLACEPVDSAGSTAGDYLLGFLLGTRSALHEKGRSSLTITLRDLNAFSVGALIALFERVVGFYASMASLNAYHQPGVEAGKRAAGLALALQGRVLATLRDAGEPRSLDELIQTVQPDSSVDLFYLLRHLAANGRIRTIGIGPFDQKYHLASVPDP